MLLIVRCTFDVVTGFQPAEVFYIFAYILTFLVVEIHRNVFGIFFVAVFVFTVL
jgi:hypothetical protein